MIDAGERAAMEETVRGAIAAALATAGEGTDVDAVLAQLGWLEMLHDQPDDAIGIVFGALGATNATASALDDGLVNRYLAADEGRGRRHPAPVRWCLPLVPLAALARQGARGLQAMPHRARRIRVLGQGRVHNQKGRLGRRR